MAEELKTEGASESPEELVLIARVKKAHGLKGELGLQTFTADEKRFQKLKRVYARNKKGEIRELIITGVRFAHELVLMAVEGVQDRDAAEDLRGMEILVPASERPKLPAGRVYFDELIGMAVIDDASGETLGSVRDILEMPAAEVFVLDLKGTEHLLTSGGTEIVKIDKKKRELRVSLLPQYGS